MKKSAFLVELLSIFLTIVLFTNTVGCAPNKSVSTKKLVSKCGEWAAEVVNSDKDKRIGIALQKEAYEDDCNGVFALSNQTSPSIGGISFSGYAMKLDAAPSDATINYLPYDKPFLIPGLAMEVKATPNDINKRAGILLQGKPTVDSILGIDLTLFLLRAALESIPNTAECAITSEQLFMITLQLSPIVEKAGRLAFEGNFIKSREELQKVLPAFYEKAADYGESIGVGCLTDQLKNIAKKPVLIIKISLDYLTWIPVIFIDYWKYEARPATISMSYTPLSLLVSDGATPGAEKNPISTPVNEIITTTPPSAQGAGPGIAPLKDSKILYVNFPVDLEEYEEGVFLVSPDTLDQAKLYSYTDENGYVVGGGTGSVTCALTAPTCIITGGGKFGVQLYNTATGVYQKWPDSEDHYFSDVVISPNGQRVIYTRHEDGLDAIIFIANFDGTNALKLLELPADATFLASSPVWSPDSTKIAFQLTPGDRPTSLSIINADGTGLKTLFTNDPIESEDTNSQRVYGYIHPTWSPDGQQIAFYKAEAGIYKIKVDGSGLTPLNEDGWAPLWSPDGTKILFSACTNNGKFDPAEFCWGSADLFTINPDGSGVVQLTTVSELIYIQAAWSPDGKSIAYLSEQERGVELSCGEGPGSYACKDIYIIGADGSNKRRITENPTKKGDLLWSP